MYKLYTFFRYMAEHITDDQDVYSFSRKYFANVDTDSLRDYKAACYRMIDFIRGILSERED